jgi:hypothetical protein
MDYIIIMHVCAHILEYANIMGSWLISHYNHQMENINLLDPFFEELVKTLQIQIYTILLLSK